MFELNTPLRRCHVAAHFQISRPPRKSATHPNSAFFPVFTCTANPFRLAQCYQLPHIRMLAAFPLHRRLRFVLVVSARTCYNNSSGSKIARFRKNPSRGSLQEGRWRAYVWVLGEYTEEGLVLSSVGVVWTIQLNLIAAYFTYFAARLHTNCYKC